MSKILTSQIQKFFSLCSTKPIFNKRLYHSAVLKAGGNSRQAYMFTCISLDSPQARFYTEKKDVTVQKQQFDSDLSTDVKTTIKETTKTVSYTAVIIIGVGVTAALFFAVFRELFSSKSPSGVYSQAFKKCCNDTRIQDSLGVPIKAHGEETSRGRRRHVSHVNYEKDGIPHIRMIFYLVGSRNTGTVHLEMKENMNGDLEYRYLFVQLDDYTRRVIVLEDNRAFEDAAKSFKTPLDDLTGLDSHLEK